MLAAMKPVSEPTAMNLWPLSMSSLQCSVFLPKAIPGAVCSWWLGIVDYGGVGLLLGNIVILGVDDSCVEECDVFLGYFYSFFR